MRLFRPPQYDRSRVKVSARYNRHSAAREVDNRKVSIKSCLARYAPPTSQRVTPVEQKVTINARREACVQRVRVR